MKNKKRIRLKKVHKNMRNFARIFNALKLAINGKPIIIDRRGRYIANTEYEKPEKGYVRHHKNGDERESTKANMVLIEWGVHNRVHSKYTIKYVEGRGYYMLCKYCGTHGFIDTMKQKGCDAQGVKQVTNMCKECARKLSMAYYYAIKKKYPDYDKVHKIQNRYERGKYERVAQNMSAK